MGVWAKNSEETLQKMAHMMIEMVPFSKFLSISVDKVEHGKVFGCIAYDERFETEQGSGIIHGGAVATAIDNLSALAALTLCVPPQPLVTLDLRIDYNSAPELHKDIYIESECYRTTKNVSFVRSLAHNGDRENVIAHSVSVFMRAQTGAKGVGL